MSPPLLPLLQRDPDSWIGLVWLAIFVVFPLVARLIRALLSRAGLAPPAEEDERAATARRAEERRLRREERRRAEAEGEDLWRRLARGEDVTVPTREIPLPVPPVVTASETAQAVREVSLELEPPSEPLSVLGRVVEPSEAPERSLESSAAPAPLLSLGALVESPSEATLPRRAFTLARGDLRRAMLLAEIVGPPVSDRPLRA